MDKKITDLNIAPAIEGADVSILVHNDTDYKFSFDALLNYIGNNLATGAAVTFGTTLPQNNTGKNGDVFIDLSTGSYAQKTSGTWAIVYTPAAADLVDSTVRYGLGAPSSLTGSNNDTYVDTSAGKFYKKTSDTWNLVFTMLNGPAGTKGDKGDKGDTGAAGRTISFGASTPSNSDGANGDFYIKTSTFELFGPKAAGAWGSGVSLVGPQGEKGDKGDKGDTGQGVPVGGSSGNVLTKLSGDDYDTEWTEIDVSFAGLSGEPTDNAALDTALDGKVDKVTGYGLSQENYTTSEKDKLANLSEHFKGKYTTSSALIAANPTGNLGDYAFVDAGTGQDSKMYIWDGDDNIWVLSSGSVIPDATETSSGLVELATVAEALARTDDQRAMTALKTIALILDEKKKVTYQINPVGLNEVSILMENAGQVNSTLVSGASNVKLKIGLSGTYPLGTQTYPFTYAASDRVFITYNYTDLFNASCNVKLKCQDN